MTTTASAEKHWDCHEHRDELCVSDAGTVYHPEHGQLCYVEKHWDCFLYHPIQFKTLGAAHRWIERGTIAELQEGLGTLGIGFGNLSFEWRNRA